MYVSTLWRLSNQSLITLGPRDYIYKTKQFRVHSLLYYSTLPFCKYLQVIVDKVNKSSKQIILFRDNPRSCSNCMKIPELIINSQRRTSRKMYWSGRGQSLNIEQANMDGSARTTLVSSGLVWVTSLAMDYQNRLLYWCDAGLHKIERVDLQGNNRVLILDSSLGFLHPFGLALFGDALFWFDLNHTTVHKYNITTSRSEVVIHGMGLPMEYIYVYDQSKDFFG